MNFKNIFKKPPVEYRGCTFWSLNDRLGKKELEQQLIEFKQGGMGGVFLHSREGLLTEYLSDEWFDLLGFAIEKAEELGLKAWLYDEDKWPSGYAGGLLTQKSEEYRMKVLARVSIDENLPANSQLLAQDDKFNYLIVNASMGDPKFNGSCYTDLMNPEAVEYFIETTYEQYKKRFSKYFGNVIPGFFTDEPTFGIGKDSFARGLESFPYSPWLDERYRQIYGESFLNHLGELFESNQNSMKYRYRYFNAMTKQFVNAYTKRIAKWCADNNLLLTGHYMYEDTIDSQSSYEGSAIAHLEYMQVPGIDHLSLDIENPLTAKQCSSIANQQGKKIVMSEMFGGAGQNMTFEDRMWIGGWHAVMGINFVCHHLSHYSMRGCRKYDYPPTLSAHQPYWDKNFFVEDYQSRLACLLRNSDFQADFMIIHPDESGWCLKSSGKTRLEMSLLDKMLAELIDEMFAIHRDFDFANEDFLVKNAKINDDKFKVGKMSYRAVIIPSMTTIRKTTLDLLEKFKQNGGCVISILPTPRLINGERAKVFNRLLSICETMIQNLAELEDVLNVKVPPVWKIKGENIRNVFMQRRKFNDKDLFLLFNSSRRQSSEIEFSKNGKWTEYLLEDGEIKNSDVTFSLAPAQTRAFLFEGDCDSSQAGKKTSKTETCITLDKSWKFECQDENILVLDFLSWSRDLENWTEPRPMAGIREHLQSLNYCGPLYFRFEFNVQEVSEIKIYSEELPANSRIMINNHELNFEKTELLRSSMIYANADEFIKSGINIIEVHLDYIQGNRGCFENVEKRYGTEIENLYLIGKFGVFNDDSQAAGNLPSNLFDDQWNLDLPERRLMRIVNPVYIKSLPKQSEDGELTNSGLAFYTGKVSMKQSFLLDDITGTFKVKFEQLDAITAQVKINGHIIPKLFCSYPLEADISEFVHNGENEVEVVLTNSLRNLFGPHHLAIGAITSVSPVSFVNRDFTGHDTSKIYNWDSQINRSKLISWIDDYYVVRFGLYDSVKIICEKSHVS